jgi:hypothetical protein
MSEIISYVRSAVREFCLEFVADPYLCYTEHGLHALFYTRLYQALPAGQRYTTWQGQKVCVVQKEYATAGNLGKPQRQHWDIAVIKTPPESLVGDPALSYDYLKLAAAVEFGMNEAGEHLLDDIERLCHPDSNVEQGFVVHLYRLSRPGAQFSNRDWSPRSPRILSPERVAKLARGRPVEMYYGMHDSTGRYVSRVWRLNPGAMEPLG